MATASIKAHSQLEKAPGLSYEVRIAEVVEQVDPNSFGIPAFVKERKLENGMFQYTCGEFTTLRTAEHYKQVLGEFVESDVTILAFIDNKLSTAQQVQQHLKAHAEGMATKDDKPVEKY